MKNENALNAYLAKEFKRRSPHLNYLKASDKYSIGVPDFLMWFSGIGAAVESKFIKAFPKRDTTWVMTHPFSGTQLTFMTRMRLAGAPAFGLLGVGEEKSLYLIESQHIPSTGNWTKNQFKEAGFPCYDIKDVERLLIGIFYP